MDDGLADAVAEHRGTLEAIAASDLPLAEDCERLLSKADAEPQAAPA